MSEQMEKPYKEVKSGGYTYQVFPVTGRAAFHLDRKVTDIFCMFVGAKTMSDFKTKMIGAFGNMADDEFDSVVKASLGNVVRLGDPENGKPNVRVTPDNVYDIFIGDVDGLYGLLFSLWEAYNLTPFVIAKKAREAKQDHTGA